MHFAQRESEFMPIAFLALRCATGLWPFQFLPIADELSAETSF
jgi:hypothetical protein